jgi:hypothetical protein
MASVVEVGNSALDKLGVEVIVSLAQNSRNARAINRSYVRIRDRLLRQHPWNFAIKRAQLAASATAPPFGKANAFPLPSDFLRLLPPDPADNLNSLDWQIENHNGSLAILTDDGAPLEVRYIYRATDPNAMDALFLELWAVEIAFDICKEITNSNTAKESLREDRKQILAEAKRNNAIENVAGQPPMDTWITARL